MLGLPDVPDVGIEWDMAACQTASSAGHTRVRADVRDFCLDGFRELVWLMLFSPPCQAWSKAGKRLGILDQAAIYAHASRVIASGQWEPYGQEGPLPAGEGDQAGTWHDYRSPLVLEVIRWVLATRPENIALEQVPAVLPFWRMLTRWLQSLGYVAWAGVLSAERYGVPQTRGRAILIASRTHPVAPPQATHTAYDPTLPDGGRWHGTDDSLFGTGLQPWVSMADALGRGPVPSGVVNTRGNRTTPGGNEFSMNRPSWALTETTRSWVMGDVKTAKGTVRPAGSPSATIPAAMDNGNWRWAQERPSTTVQGDPRIAAPGHRCMAPGCCRGKDPEPMFTNAVRVTVEEAAALQSFPEGYPWAGTRSAQFRQIGDAVPPLLAAHVIAAAVGADVSVLADRRVAS
jgi:DNA (cytosine-5)-methyltransferase 1